MKDKCGIYKITSSATGKVYIGSSINIRKRKNSHLCELRNGKHPNNMLQNTFNKYGENDINFDIILECEPETLLINEEEQINLHNSYNNGYNLTEKPSSNMLGYKHTDESKEKMSITKKHIGRINGCLTKQEVTDIRQRFFDGARNSELAYEFKIHRKTIRECVLLRTYVDIPCEIEGYLEMLEDIRRSNDRKERPRSRGWKHSKEFTEKIRKINTKPKKHRQLADEQIREIRNRYSNGETYKTLSEEYGVNQNSISRIVKKVIYYDVE